MEETEISRRGFSKLLGGWLGSSTVLSKNLEGKTEKDSLSGAGEFRIVDVKDYRSMSFPYDVEVKVEYGENPTEEVEYNRFLFDEDDLENSELGISSDLLDYVRSKDVKGKRTAYRAREKNFPRTF